MAFFSETMQHLQVLRDALGDDLEAERLPVAVDGLCDDSLVAALEAATALVRAGEKVRIAASGAAAARSTRESGHEGLAQKRGHRSPASLIQEITGGTKAEAAKHVRLGESLRAVAGIDGDVTDAAAPGNPEDPHDPGSVGASTPVEPWHAPLGRALLAGTISSAQHDAIQRGLGEPPAPVGIDGDDDAADEIDLIAQAREVWSLAAEQLIAEAAERTVEELARTARTVRDQLDPEGAQRRFDERFDARSFRMWRDADGIRRGAFAFEDVGGTWLQTILDAALRPRRGGPRFVDSDEKARADQLVDDPRTNDQLAYDLILDVLRAGALADADTLFGTRQAGVRLLITEAALDSVAKSEPAVALVEDDQTAIPGWLVGQHLCDSGAVECTLDTAGNPLDLGREARLYSPKQRVALAIRDGGCRWKGCDRPASYCESHHIDEWDRDSGRTDIDRGILLCRWHHMELHHGGWNITRAGRGDFILHPPPGRGDPIVLTPRLALRYAWSDIDPPPKRFLPAA